MEIAGFNDACFVNGICATIGRLLGAHRDVLVLGRVYVASAFIMFGHPIVVGDDDVVRRRLYGCSRMVSPAAYVLHHVIGVFDICDHDIVVAADHGKARRTR